LTACRQNLRDGVAMDVDEEEEDDSTQRLRKVPDYGIEVDFGILSANEREVRAPVSMTNHGALFLRDGFGIGAELLWRGTWGI